MPSFPELEQLLAEKFDGIVTMVFEPRGIMDGEPHAVADAFVSRHGFKPIQKRWSLLDESTAASLISKMLHRSLAYHVEMLSQKTSEHFAHAFRMLFDQFSVTCVSNGSIGQDSAGWAPITASTFEMAVVMYDATKIGMICVEDED
ncbi:MAG: hypothetical protein V4819_04235 [Verrucomicrobiota bacterium]